MRAPADEQATLLPLQEQDRLLARLITEQARLPIRARLADLTEAHAEAERAAVLARTAVSDARRELSFAEGEVQRVRDRRERQQRTLDSGALDPKSLVNLQSELEHLAGRQSELEDLELEAMEGLEEAEDAAQQAGQRVETLAEEVAEASRQTDNDSAALDAKIAKARTDRETIAEKISADLLSLYEEVRARTGGLAVVVLEGTCTTPVTLDFSLHELDAIRSTPADEVYVSEEHDYIVVRRS
ncbi:MAG: hypothetical protein Q4P36_01000 [Bowdeniella nasicola]|nr:hypothetical protein [Bowdeniella nasicola]